MRVGPELCTARGAVNVGGYPFQSTVMIENLPLEVLQMIGLFDQLSIKVPERCCGHNNASGTMKGSSEHGGSAFKLS